MQQPEEFRLFQRFQQHQQNIMVQVQQDMMSGAVDNLLSTEAGSTHPTAFPEAPLDPTVPIPDNPSMLDKNNDFIPGAAGQKV